MNLNEFVNALSYGKLDAKLKQLYGNTDMALLRNKARYLSAAEKFSRLYPVCGDIRVFSVPEVMDLTGGVCAEIGGCKLSAAVDRDVFAIASLNDEGVIRVATENGTEVAFKTSQLKPLDDEKGNFAALVRAVASKTENAGIALSGMDIYIASSAEQEKQPVMPVLLAYVIGALCGDNASSEEITLRARSAESSSRGAVCSLSDYTLCADGGVIFVDSAFSDEPDIRRLNADISADGYCLCVTSTGKSEEESAASDINKIAAELGADTLNSVNEEGFFASLPVLRTKFSDILLAKATGFYIETERVRQAAELLEIGDTDGFFKAVDTLGGICSESLGSDLSHRLLGENGAVIDSGSRDGKLKFFVPGYLTDDYISEMERVFGIGSCQPVNIRMLGACEIIV
jgi:galactokinase